MEHALKPPPTAIGHDDRLRAGPKEPTADPRAAWRSPLPEEPFAPNEVIVWNRILLFLLGQPATGRPLTSGAAQLAAMHLAIADAVAVLSGRYRPYASAAGPPRAGSHGLAAAAAAHAVLVDLHPRWHDLLDGELAVSLRTTAGGSRQRVALATGVSAARAVLARCLRAGASDEVDWWRRGGASDGVDSLIGPPFVVEPDRAAGPLAAGPPPDTGSWAYRADLAEVRSLGERGSGSRLGAHTDAALFWSQPSWSRWNGAAQVSSLINHNSVAGDARMFALLNVALSDVSWVVRRAKRVHQVARPVEVIGTGRRPVPGWTPLEPSPTSPSYPSLRSAASVAAAVVLETEFGNRFGLELAAPGAARARRYRSFRAAAAEAGVSAIYAGAHFRFDHVEGERLGVAVARQIQAEALRPAGGSQA